MWADAASCSQKIEAQLKSRQLRSRNQYKRYRNTPLKVQQKTMNRGRTRIRSRVEHVFSHQVTAMGGQPDSEDSPGAGASEDRAKKSHLLF